MWRKVFLGPVWVVGGVAELLDRELTYETEVPWIFSEWSKPQGTLD